jgi:hypothetical protein
VNIQELLSNTEFSVEIIELGKVNFEAYQACCTPSQTMLKWDSASQETKHAWIMAALRVILKHNANVKQ